MKQNEERGYQSSRELSDHTPTTSVVGHLPRNHTASVTAVLLIKASPKCDLPQKSSPSGSIR